MRSSYEPLPAAFFLPNPTVVAPALIGKWIVRREHGRERRARIVETEAYLGLTDPAAHASHGLTRRTAILYGPPGRAYIYLSYGIHLCLNVSTCRDGEAGGVLFRAAVEWEGGGDPRALRGPGKLTRGLEIGADLNGCDLTRPGPLFLADDGAARGPIIVSARVGVSKAAEQPYRYYLEGERAVSGKRTPVLGRLPAAPGRKP
jgi:DNA-3-methyladenine glycosylase